VRAQQIAQSRDMRDRRRTARHHRRRLEQEGKQDELNVGLGGARKER